MKNSFFLMAILGLLITFSSCKNNKIENCIEDMIGTYNGNQLCGSELYENYTAIISEGAASDQVSVQIYADVTLAATVDEDCNLTFTNQIVPIGTYDVSFSGTGTYDEDNLDLTVVQSIDAYSFTCTWNLSK